MKIERKKILAREFLLLISCSVIGVLFFFFTNLYNYFKNSELNRINTEILFKEILSDSLINSFKKKQETQVFIREKLYEHKFSLENPKNNWTLTKVNRNNNLREEIERIQKFEKFLNSHEIYYSANENLTDFDTSLSVLSAQFKINFESEESYKPFAERIKVYKIQSFQNVLKNNQITRNDILNRDKSLELTRENNLLYKKVDVLKSSMFDSAQKINLTLIIFVVAILIFFPLRYLYYTIVCSIKTLKP